MSRFNKQRNILDFTLSSLLRRRTKNSALVIVYTLIVFSLASVLFFTQAIKKEACIVLKNSPEIIVQRIVAGRHDLLPADYIDTIRAITGVQSAKGRLWGYYFEPAAGANYTLMVSEEPGVEVGRIVIGQGVSRTIHANRADIVPFRRYDGSYTSFEVSDILSSESELVSSDLVLISESDFREMMGIRGEYVTDAAVYAKNKRELFMIADKIKRILPDTRPITKDEILRTYEAIFDWRGGILLVILSGAVIAFVILAWDKASGLSSDERREIGILKGIGWETSDVIAMKFWEGAVISLSSFSLGIILAYIHVFFASSALFEPALKGWSVLYPEFRLVPHMDPLQIATLFFLTVVPYTVSTIVPSWRAATIDPDTVMRL